MRGGSEDARDQTSASAPDPTLSRTAARGAVTTVGGQLARMVLQVGGVALMARLLSPGDYGLLAMAAVIVGVAEILRDLGLSAATIQTRELTDAQRNSVFWINLATAGLMAGAVIGVAPLVGAFYGNPAVVPVIQCMSAIFVINGAVAQHRVALVRALRFRLLATAELVGVPVSLLASAAMATSGAGVWALVVQQVLYAAVVLLFLVISSPWRPSMPHLSESAVLPLLRFGRHMLGSNLLGFLARNADSLLIGKAYGAVALGPYDRAYQLLQLPLSQINEPLSRVAIPTLSRLQNEQQRFVAFALRGQCVLAHVATALFATGAVVAQPLVEIALGPQWGASAPLFQLLAIGGIFQSVAYAGDWILVSTGHSAQFFRYCVITRPLLIAAMAVGLLWGPPGVAAAFALGAAMTWPASLLWVRRSTGFPVSAVFRTSVRALGCYFLSSAVGYVIVNHVLAGAHPLLRVLAGIGCLLAVTGGLVAVWPALRADVVGMTALVRHLRRARTAS